MRASWPVGAPGTAARRYGAGVPYGPIFPYRVHSLGPDVADVESGEDMKSADGKHTVLMGGLSRPMSGFAHVGPSPARLAVTSGRPGDDFQGLRGSIR